MQQQVYVNTAFVASGGCYGSRPVMYELRDQGLHIGRYRLTTVSLFRAKAGDASEETVDANPCAQNSRVVVARDRAAPGRVSQHSDALLGIAGRASLQAT
ncbi:Transposase (plasmid) [Mycetohabitans rhizoxinica HKI 454]|uniref:Transposase n=1 Tax=Mycetohabitans rhizoxinica (strain DSM 19002 / CIP 109453 / HKI 454) TaxID=882378 RepID=E5AWC7_MYCRK|nr:Transposase [Mycetohabitans rhizoxinica HKI 454]